MMESTGVPGDRRTCTAAVRSVDARLLLVFGLGALLAACATREELVAKSAVVPPGVDLSGQWRLLSDDQDTVRRIDDAARGAMQDGRDIAGLTRRNPPAEERRRVRGTLVYVFLETGRALKITQTDAGLFISFDRSVVEEYRFGEKREISVGEITADRVSGWEQSGYVIETLDRNGAKMVERYRLEDGGGRLVRSIRIVANGAEQLALSQVFERAAGRS